MLDAAARQAMRPIVWCLVVAFNAIGVEYLIACE
jgi:hypothetical protein